MLYLETSAATGQNVAQAIEVLLDRVMLRMESAVDQATLPGRKGQPKPINFDRNNTEESTCCVIL